MWVALAWIERHCVVPDGFRRGEPFTLYENQGRYLAHFYLVRGDAQQDLRSPILASAFVFRRAMLVGPQKMGKDPGAAAQICLEGRGPALFRGWAGAGDGYACADFGCRCGWEYAYEPGEPMGMPWPTPLIQITAFSEDQTDNTYDALRPMIELGPLADQIPHTGEQLIRLPGGGRIETVTSSAPSRLGQRVTHASQGEVGIWTVENKMSRVADVQYRNLAAMGGRASLNTNAWDPSEHSVAQTQFESSATDVYRQFTQPPKSLSYRDRRDRRRIHRIVYPPDTWRENGGHVDLEAIDAEAADLAERDERQAMRFFGNMLVAGAGRAVEPDIWDSLAQPHEVPRGTHVGLGFDGSINQDATFLRGRTRDGYGFLIGKWIRPANAPADWRVPRDEVNDKIAWAFEYFEVGKLVADPPKWWSELDEWTARYGKERVEALDTNQHYQRFSAAVDRWLVAIAEARQALLEGRPPAYTHDADPDTDEHVKAAHLRKLKATAEDTDGRSRFVIVKGIDRKRIDGAVAEVLAGEAADTMPELEPDPGPYFVRT